MSDTDLIQGSDEWKRARIGSVGASRVADIIAKTKSGPSASRANYLAELVAERLTGEATASYVNAAMQWGTDNESEARAAYELVRDCDVVQVGLIRHLTLNGSHASPDGLIDDDGLLEIKCPQTNTHIETLMAGAIPGKYVTQMQWAMACSGRKWCDFVSYDPRMPGNMRLFIKRVPRDPAMIADLETAVIAFLKELDATVSALTAKYVEAA